MPTLATTKCPKIEYDNVDNILNKIDFQINPNDDINSKFTKQIEKDITLDLLASLSKLNKEKSQPSLEKINSINDIFNQSIENKRSAYKKNIDLAINKDKTINKKKRKRNYNFNYLSFSPIQITK